MESTDAADTSRMPGFYSPSLEVGGKLLGVDHGVEFSREKGNRAYGLQQAVAVTQLKLTKTNSHTWIRTAWAVWVDPLHGAFEFEAIRCVGVTKTVPRRR
jgi:hypothetical protein